MNPHGDHGERAKLVSERRTPAVSRPGQVRSGRRVDADKRAAEIVAQALDGRPTASSSQLAERIGVGGTSALRLVNGAAPWHIGDLLLMTSGDALAVLDVLRSKVVEASAPMTVERRQRRVSMKSGDLARAVDEALLDGRIDADEAAAIRQTALGVATEALGIVRDVVGGSR